MFDRESIIAEIINEAFEIGDNTSTTEVEQTPISYEDFIKEYNEILEDFEPSRQQCYDWDQEGLSAEDIFDSKIIITLIDSLEEKLNTNVCSYEYSQNGKYDIDVDNAAPWFKEYYWKAHDEGVFKEAVDSIENDYKLSVDMINNPAAYDTHGDDAYDWERDSEY